jgi:hypothetical protein
VPDPAFLAQMGARSAADRVALGALSRLPGRRMRQLLTLGWFWFRLRPYRLRDLLGTALSRRFSSVSRDPRGPR